MTDEPKLRDGDKDAAEFPCSKCGGETVPLRKRSKWRNCPKCEAEGLAASPVVQSEPVIENRTAVRDGRIYNQCPAKVLRPEESATYYCLLDDQHAGEHEFSFQLPAPVPSRESTLPELLKVERIRGFNNGVLYVTESNYHRALSDLGQQLDLLQQQEPAEQVWERAWIAAKTAAVSADPWTAHLARNPIAEVLTSPDQCVDVQRDLIRAISIPPYAPPEKETEG